MRGRLLCCISVVFALLLSTSELVLAHHSFAAEFLATQATWTGKVTRLLWRTPHAHFYVDVKDASGKVVNWAFELPSPEQLARRGVTRITIKVGDEVSIVGYPAKDNQPIAMTKTVKLSDGRQVFVWSYKDFGGSKSSTDGEPDFPEFEEEARP